jgi:hypothetical protein
VPDPVMFKRFLDAADYEFDCSDDSSAGSYDPTRECFMVAIGDLVDGTSVEGAGDRSPPKPRDQHTSKPGTKRPSHLAGERRRHQCVAGSCARVRG